MLQNMYYGSQSYSKLNRAHQWKSTSERTRLPLWKECECPCNPSRALSKSERNKWNHGRSKSAWLWICELLKLTTTRRWTTLKRRLRNLKLKLRWCRNAERLRQGWPLIWVNKIQPRAERKRSQHKKRHRLTQSHLLITQ